MSATNRKPRGVHPYTDGRGRRCFRIEYVGSDGGRHFKRLGPVTQKQAVQERENLNVAIRRRELVVDGIAPTFGDLSSAQRPHQEEGRRRILTADEEAVLLAYCGSRPWLRPIIVVSRNQALRLGEAAGLQRADVDFANNKLRVHQQLSREGTLALTKARSRTGATRETFTRST